MGTSKCESALFLFHLYFKKHAAYSKYENRSTKNSSSTQGLKKHYISFLFRAMVENCIALQTSISNFAVTCAVYPRTSNTIRRAIRATENFLRNQTGCTIYDVCAQTQLYDQHSLKRILRASNECTGVLHIYGEVSLQTISLLRNIACEYPTLKVLFSCNDKLILNQITTMMNCVKFEDDIQYNFLTCMAMGGLNEKIFGVVDKHFPSIFPLLQSSLKDLEAELVTDEVNAMGKFTFYFLI